MNGIDLRKVVNVFTYEVHIVLDVNANSVLTQSITTNQTQQDLAPSPPSSLT